MSLKVVIVGAVATGPKSGCRIKRLMPQASVTMLDRDNYISYGGCGIPFYVSGDVPDLQGLMATSFHFQRDARFFQGAKGIETLPGVEALAIDRAAKEVKARDLASGQEMVFAYDKLVLATGGRAFVPPIPGADLGNVLPVVNLHQAEAIKKLVSQGQVERAVVIGAGATGLEMAEALSDLWGIETHVFELAEHVLPGLADAEMAEMLQHHLSQREEITLHLGQGPTAILGDEEGNARAVQWSGGELECQLVLMCTGYRPNGQLAAAAGLEVDQAGAIKVDEHLRTSDPDIYAGGDCVRVPNLLTGKPMYLPSGSLANRMGRVIGTNVCGGSATFPGAVGSFCIKLFGLSLACTGLTEKAATAAGFDPVAPLVVQADRAHFHPDQAMMYVKLVADRQTRRVLGFTAVGDNGDAVVGRANAVAATLAHGATLEDIGNLEICYSPPLGAAMDILNSAANVCENLIEGRLTPMSLAEFNQRLAAKDGDTCFLDMRAQANAAPYLECHAPQWCHLPQEELAQRLSEVPRDKDVVLVCNSGARSYEAQVLLKDQGFDNVYNLSGGMAAARKGGVPVLPEWEEK